ncbi:gamma-glutamyltransferase, partial [Enterobacter intestinihominis]
LRVEKGFSPDTLKLLEQRRQMEAVKQPMGSTKSNMVGPVGEMFAASDQGSVVDFTAGY